MGRQEDVSKLDTPVTFLVNSPTQGAAACPNCDVSNLDTLVTFSVTNKTQSSFTMFPGDAGFVPVPPESNADAPETRNTIIFDCQTQRFAVVDGAPQVRDGTAAVRQWIELMLRTYRDRFAVYRDTRFGHTGEDLIGMRQAPPGYLHSELAREIREACKLCPAIARADQFDFQRQGRTLVVRFVVTLKTGEQEEVSGIVG